MLSKVLEMSGLGELNPSLTVLRTLHQQCIIFGRERVNSTNTQFIVASMSWAPSQPSLLTTGLPTGLAQAGSHQHKHLVVVGKKKDILAVDLRGILPV